MKLFFFFFCNLLLFEGKIVLLTCVYVVFEGLQLHFIASETRGYICTLVDLEQEKGASRAV